MPQEIESEVGYLEDFENCENEQEGLGKFRSKVVVHRKEGMKLPVEVAIHFENGDEEILLWNGQKAATSFIYESDHKVVKAVVDPNNKITIDNNWINNSYSLEPDKTGLRYYFSKIFMATQRAIESLMVLI